LVPIFFVMMGFQVDLRSFRDPQVLILAAAITVAAIIGKQACSLGAIGRGIDRLSIGFGMIPRGEVGLIFAAIGQGLVSNGKPVIEPSVYSAVVVMVMVTTFVTPPLLNWSLQRQQELIPVALIEGHARETICAQRRLSSLVRSRNALTRGKSGQPATSCRKEVYFSIG
jgi:Kef-type K+ transport system membrane component KefB